jgi:asparagine synthase (glutamine-hydrolysing)
MCGILGVVSNGSDVRKYQDGFKKMLTVQNHRGPDENGKYISERCLLGHNRLSIVDIKSGQQPMYSHDEKKIISFNGEIYGFKKIRSSIEYPYKTNSDTEVIFALYQKYGKEMMNFLPGMFAFAIWDSENQELFFARDRVGEKPFYYHVTSDGDLIFASEVKTIADSKIISLEVDKDSLSHYLSKLYVHPGHSIYKNVYSLLPGHCGTFSKERGLEIWQYWKPNETPVDIGFMEAVEELEFLLDKSIEEQLIADVPVSVFLSGGLDSSTVAACARRRNDNIKALTFRFQSGLDEGQFAHDVAKLHKINIEDLYEDSIDSILQHFLNSIDCYGEPFADSSSIPTMLICKAAARRSKVVLAGDGADELFGGYVGRYRPAVFMEKYAGSSRLRWLAMRYIYGVCNKLMPSELNSQKSRAVKYLIDKKTIAEYTDLTTIVFKDEDLKPFGLRRQPPVKPEVQNKASSAMSLDIKNYLPSDILVKTDRASMAFGLEVRAPFLSVDILNFAYKLPSEFKIDSDRDKIIMRAAFSKHWPESVVQRSKQGFGAPMERWMKDKDMTEYFAHVFSSNAKIYQYMPKSFIDSHINSSALKRWTLFCLAAWLERAPI